MPEQPVFRSLSNAMKKKQTRRELFLAEMDAVVPRTRLMAMIASSQSGIKNLVIACMTAVWSRSVRLD